MSIIEQINKAMGEHSKRVAAARQDRIDRKLKEVAKQNDGAVPIYGRGGRYHAPFDGYYYDDGERDGTYLAGEFLPIYIDPDNDSGRFGSFTRRKTTRIECADSVRAKEVLGANIDGYVGKEFDKFGSKVCHLYLTGKVQSAGSVLSLITDYVNEPVKSAKIADKKAKAAEYEYASPVPKTDKRINIEGTVMSVKVVDGYRGEQTIKMLVKTSDGWKAWGSVPSSIYVERGDYVKFDAAIRASDDDPKFGFYSRPTKASVIRENSKCTQ